MGTQKGKALLIIIFFLIFIIICLQIFGSIKAMKALYTANVIIAIIIFLGSIGCYLFKWDTLYVSGLCIGFGLSAILTLKIKQFKEDKTKLIPSAVSNDERTENKTIKSWEDTKYSQIEM